MSARPCGVDGCDRPVQNATVCTTCEATLERDLAEVSAYRNELEVSLTRQAVMGERNGARSAEKALPYNQGASEALVVLRSTLVGWVRVAVEEDDAHWPADTLDAMAALLLARISWLRNHPSGNEAVEEIGAAMDLARRVVDRPAPRWFAGPCECGEGLYARPGASDVACRKCELVYDVAERREWLRTATEGHLGTAAEISALCRQMFGELVTASMIRGYAHRGAIASHGAARDQRGREVPLYRLGEVFASAARAASDPNSRRDAKRAAREAAEMSDPAGTKAPRVA